ncbi:MAG TPA: hypothetical protein VL986_08285 [Terracidiphilus sp.]|nr:hypothetical protein [Terracidiphilus sp.]
MVSLTLDATSHLYATGQRSVTNDSYLTSLTDPFDGYADITCANGAPSCIVYVGRQLITVGN